MEDDKTDTRQLVFGVFFFIFGCVLVAYAWFQENNIREWNEYLNEREQEIERKESEMLQLGWDLD